MKVKTKFDVQQEVYILKTSDYSYPKIIKLKIRNIKITINGSGDSTNEYVFLSQHFGSIHTDTGYKTYEEHHVFSTKQELLKNLEERK